MKKAITRLSLILGFGLMVNATQAQNLSLGVRGGMQWSQFSKVATDNSLQGANVGLTAVYSNWENFGFGGDVLFSRSGGQYQTISDFGMVENYRVQNDYVRVVPKAMFFFRDVEDAFRPKATIGLSMGVMTKSQDIYRNQVQNEFFRSVDGAGQVGLGFNWKVASKTWVQFDAEYMLGFVKANDSEVYNPNNLYNNTLGLSLGLAFGLGD